MSTTPLAPSEYEIWRKQIRARAPIASDEEISAKYDSKLERIVTETNREKLQNFYEALKRPGYMEPKPHYQRRQRWTPERQSQLIESFLINIPIPPLFVYETRPNSYEVMDGQQRISAIKAFYSNELTLKGLERWPELNGRTYSKLPERIRNGIDRRSISWVTVLSESSESDEDALSIKQLVFERLNTGGVRLSHQEIRNALYSGPFNTLLIELSKLPSHRAAWGLPPYSTAEEAYVPPSLSKPFYLEMQDVEVILRFFALRHAEHYTRGMRGFLDLFMQRASMLRQDDLLFLRSLYISVIELAVSIFEDKTFCPFLPEKGEWGHKRQKAFADAVLVALSENLHLSAKLVVRKHRVRDFVAQAFRDDANGVLVGRANTKADVVSRITLMREVFQNALAAP